MAPKKIDPKKLLQKAKKEKDKQQQKLVDPDIKPVVAPDFKKPMNPVQIKKEQKYEEDIKAFFTQIQNLPLPKIDQGGVIELEEDPTELISAMFDVFAGSHPTNYWPTKLIDRILTSLDPILYVDFATKYLRQTGTMIIKKPNGIEETVNVPIYGVKDFFNVYVTRPSIAERLKRYYETRDLHADEIARLQKIVEQEFPEQPEEIPEVPQFGPIKKPPGYKTKYKDIKFIDQYLLIDPKTGQPIGGKIELPQNPKTPYKKHNQKIRPMAEINCKKIFLHSSWLGGIIDNVYITPATETPLAPDWKEIISADVDSDYESDLGALESGRSSTPSWLRDAGDAAAALPPLGALLAPDWKEIINVDGQPYYYNMKTHKKQTQKPVVIPEFKDIDPIIRPYINNQKPATVNNGTLWYIPNQLFFDLLCNQYSTHQRQEGDIFTGLDKQGKMVSMKIGFETNKGFTILNEELFANWRKYKQKILMGRQAKIMALITEPFNPLLKEIGRVQLSTALHNIAPQVGEYGYTKEIPNPNDDDDTLTILNTETVFNNTVIENITAKSSTNQDFIEILATIVRGLEDSRATLFHSRIADRYYLPEILADVSLEEIYPAELSPNLPKKTLNSNLTTIQAGIKSEFDHILEMFYKRLYPTESSPTMAKMDFVKKLPKGCVNRQDIPEDKIIYYRSQDDETVYCLNLDEIIRGLVMENTYQNPLTKKDLDPGFIQQFKLLYYKQLEDVGYKPPEIDLPSKKDPKPGTDPKPQVEELAPGLLDLLFSKLDDCKKEIDDDLLTPQGKCKSLDDEKEDDDTQDDGETTEEDDTPSEDNDDTPSEDNDDTPSEDNDVTPGDLFGTDDSKSSFPTPRDVPQEGTCIKCNSQITNQNYKTIKQFDDNQYQTLQFCGPECFEKYSKFSCKKGKKGRHGTKDR